MGGTGRKTATFTVKMFSVGGLATLYVLDDVGMRIHSGTCARNEVEAAFDSLRAAVVTTTQELQEKSI